jgi:hypothetical protein
MSSTHGLMPEVQTLTTGIASRLPARSITRSSRAPNRQNIRPAQPLPNGHVGPEGEPLIRCCGVVPAPRRRGRARRPKGAGA